MPEPDKGLYEQDEARWASLMCAAQQGDQASYRRLLTEIGEAVSRYLSARFGPVDMLEDCVQEVLMAVHQGRHTYDPRKPFRPWLFTIARHKAIDALRKQSARREAPVEAAGELATAEEHDHLDGGRLLGKLSGPYREAVTLTKIAGLSNAEAAARLKISESAVKLRVHRGVNRLKRLMEAEPI